MYLGGLFDFSSAHEVELRRIQQAWAEFGTYREEFTDKPGTSNEIRRGLRASGPQGVQSSEQSSRSLDYNVKNSSFGGPGSAN